MFPKFANPSNRVFFPPLSNAVCNISLALVLDCKKRSCGLCILENEIKVWPGISFGCCCSSSALSSPSVPLDWIKPHIYCYRIPTLYIPLSLSSRQLRLNSYCFFWMWFFEYRRVIRAQRDAMHLALDLSKLTINEFVFLCFFALCMWKTSERLDTWFRFCTWPFDPYKNEKWATRSLEE